MTERKWTPGPWVVNTHTGEEHPWIDAECNHTVDGNGVEQYMSVSGMCGMANAHLIAAAPDLYEACEAVFDAADMTGKEQYAALKLVVAAMAKAWGEK